MNIKFKSDFITIENTKLFLVFLFFFSSSLKSLAITEMAIIGDAGRTTASSKIVRESILSYGVSRLVLPGDNLYSGTYKSVWSPWIAAKLSFDLVAIGNHNNGYQKEMTFFSMPREYYSKVIDGARFIILNSDNDSTATTQINWLNDELNNAKESLVFLVYHHPTYTISNFHKWEEKPKFQKAIRPVIWANRSKITALFVGHDHLATLLHFNDLPVIVSGAVHEQRRDKAINYVSDGVSIKTAWFFDRNPHWARLSFNSNSHEASVDFIRAKDNEITCSFILRTGEAAQLDKNCQASHQLHLIFNNKEKGVDL